MFRQERKSIQLTKRCQSEEFLCNGDGAHLWISLYPAGATTPLRSWGTPVYLILRAENKYEIKNKNGNGNGNGNGDKNEKEEVEGRCCRVGGPVRWWAVSWRAIREISSSNAVTSRRRKGLQLNESEMKISSVEGVRYRSPAHLVLLRDPIVIEISNRRARAISAIARWYYGVTESLASCHSSVKCKRRDPSNALGDTDGDRRIDESAFIVGVATYKRARAKDSMSFAGCAAVLSASQVLGWSGVEPRGYVGGRT
ncbi:hypothetical protein HZH66_007692 [Vespula vulgaris]|uniref:Uncharacterized protein n=1 Tax=Vespula vulgaris TaxID=7454 RepID=A0A834N4Z0_VESVU|nr:hypothetical protein HZH66_007692 [Vespula vulgaris]